MTNPTNGNIGQVLAQGLSEAERHQILVEWNATARDYPADECLHNLFEAQVSASPDSVALVCDQKTITYAELNQRANRVARSLHRQEIGRHTLVAVFMERSVDLVAALYGILKAGSAYVPIDPEYPEARITFMLQDANASVLLTQAHLESRIPVRDAHVIIVDAEDGAIAQEKETNLALEVASDDLAYVIYTSGSTGKPKGVQITHRAICNRLFWMQDAYRLTNEDRILQKTPFSFDVSVWEFFWPLLFGAQLVVAPPGRHRDSGYLVGAVVRHGITTMHFVPSMLNLFLDHPRVEECTQLRRIICSGESLSKALQDRFFDRLDAELHNLYGPTEAAVDVTAWSCQRESDLPFVPIGHPIANTQIYLLDPELNPVPIGEPGELHIGGVQVAKGYLRRPQLTVERFIDDPFDTSSGARLYKTGDLARWLPDGAIEFLGRSDFQVKIRGFRVELGEIEAAIESTRSVSQSVVVALDQSDGDKRLVAYFTHEAQPAVSVDRLRDDLQARLPDYMIPSVLVPLDSFPLMPNGKVNRNALPVPTQQRPELSHDYVEPRDELERYLAAEWSTVLDLETIGIQDRFFELGGTSLQAARLMNRLEEELGEPIFVVTLFSAPSIEEYAAFLRKEYPDPVSKRFGEPHGGPNGSHQPGEPQVRITEASIQLLQPKIPGLRPVVDDDSTKNPPAVFVLAPPRSGTTLLRIMLAGHPKLFAASELQLLGFHTMAERAEAYTGKFSIWLDGTIRAIMELKNCGPEEAKKLVKAEVDQQATTQQFYRLLQEWIGDRVLVDKSPSYALDREALEKAEREFDQPIYIHLVRHPQAVIPSFVKRRMDQAMYLHDHPFNAKQLAELIWTMSHRTVTEFLANLPRSRWHRVKFEDLVAQPYTQMEELCTKLGLAFDEQIVRPYDGLDQKMTDGVYAESTPMGDTKFFAHGRINPGAAEAWKAIHGQDVLGDPTRKLAESFGYDLAPSPHIDGAGSDPKSGRRSLERQRRRRRTNRDHQNV